MKRIWIDPGHGGADSGALGPNGRMEKDDNLRCALLLAGMFLQRGLEPVLTRTDDSRPGYAQRTALERGCHLAISCHRNGAADPSANGAEIWLHSRAPQRYVDWASAIMRGFGALGLRIRTPYQNQLAAPGVLRGFRGRPDADYYANSGTQSPSMLIELGFVGSDEDNRIFDRRLEELCRVICQESCAFLGLAGAGPQSPSPGQGCQGCRERDGRIAAAQVALEEADRALKSG